MFKDVTDFVKSLYSSSEGFIPLHAPCFAGNEKKYLLNAIDSTFVSSVGAYVDQFEMELAKYVGAKYAVAVVNGTSALHISLRLVGVEQNDEVITQSLSFVATVNAIAYQKAIPHFVDVDESTLSLSAIALEMRLKEVAEMRDGICFNKVTDNRIMACVPMHTFGFPAEIDKIVEVCSNYNIAVVEDAAESLGSRYKNKYTGTFGRLGTYSFNGNKTITCGGGGAIVTDDEASAKRAKHITTTAKIPHKWEFAHDELGFNYRMPNLNAALACAQLEQIENYIVNKRQTAERYKVFFEKNTSIDFISEPSNSKANYWLNAVKFTDRATRDAFLTYTNDNGVMTRPIWKLLNELPMYETCPSGDLSVSRTLADTIVNIPSSVRI